jgi:hypothetical protein
MPAKYVFRTKSRCVRNAKHDNGNHHCRRLHDFSLHRLLDLDNVKIGTSGGSREIIVAPIE